jgi:hypothetical protein
VTDLTDRVMEVRCLVSARNAGEAFDLRCHVREEMIRFLRENHPEALPTDRLSFSLATGDATASTPRRSSPPQGAKRSPQPVKPPLKAARRSGAR